MLRPGVCARCRSTWVPESEHTTGPVYCPLCRLQTSPQGDRLPVLGRQLVRRLVGWPGMAGIPVLLLALVFSATLTRNLLIRKTMNNPAPSPVTTTTMTAPSPRMNSEYPALATPAPSRPEPADIEIVALPQPVALPAVPPPVIPVEDETVPVSKQIATEPPVQAAEAAKQDPPKVCEKPAGMFGTSLYFAANPTEARKKAATQEKLVFLLHVSGDFDDPGFT
jgi:hypothetical protein